MTVKRNFPSFDTKAELRWYNRLRGGTVAFSVFGYFSCHSRAGTQYPQGNACLLYGLKGDGCLLEEICNTACETNEIQEAVLEEMTYVFLPQNVFLEMALQNEVPTDAIAAR